MAVYTEVTDTELDLFLAEYDIGTLVAFRGIAEGVENSNFSVRTTTGDFILTLYERRVDPRDLPWFLGLMEHLSRAGLVCPLPVAGRDGAKLRRLAGRDAAITTFLAGVWPREVSTAQCHLLGAALARLHLAQAGYAPDRANALGPSSWRALIGTSRAQGDTLRPGLMEELDRHLDVVLAAWPDRLPRGHIHADLFPDNVFFLDGAVSGLIDFYFACTDFLAYDIAVCLNAWCFTADARFEPERSRALLGGYRTVRALEPSETAALPVLARGAALRFCATRLHDWLHTPAGAQVVRKDPLEYLARARAHASIPNAAAYG